MKTSLIVTVLFFSFQPLQNDEKIVGTWKLAENKTELEIVKDGDIYKGTVVKSEVEKAIGKEILQDFKKDGDVWKGKFYAVKRNRLVDATIKESGENSLEMKVTAGRRSKTINLTRSE